MAGIRLIIGLGNPGAKYIRTRHNAGFWFVDALAQADHANFRHQPKVHGDETQLDLDGHRVRLLKPATFMNHSGRSVLAAVQYYKLQPEECLIVHDDLDLPPGTARLKFDGGHGGQNGMRDIIKHLGHGRIHRLRIGIGRPLQRSAVLDWVLGTPSANDEDAILDAMAHAMQQLPLLLSGDFNEAMKRLHTRAHG